MQHHEFATLFPMLPDSELQTLADDIAANGLQTPITTLDGMILDGRNRHRACEIAGVDPTFEEYLGGDPLAFVLSHNLHRRHLTESQRGMVAARLATMKRGGDRRSEDFKTPIGALKKAEISDVAAALNVGSSTVDRARRVQRDCAPEMISAVEAGDVTLNMADNLRDLSHEDQSAVVAKGKAALESAAKKLRETKEKETAPKPEPSSRMPKIGIGMDRAERAICWLEEISDSDPQRAEALTHVIEWCNKQLNKTR